VKQSASTRALITPINNGADVVIIRVLRIKFVCATFCNAAFFRSHVQRETAARQRRNVRAAAVINQAMMKTDAAGRQNGGNFAPRFACGNLNLLALQVVIGAKKSP
jgi:hypothetical protein